MDKKQIKISEVISLLDSGKTREEIAEHFEISKSEVKKLFMHPKLKGKKSKKQTSFVIEDDLESENSFENLETSENSSNFEEEKKEFHFNN